MAHKFQAVLHEVEAHKIVNVQPLIAQGRVLAPDAGLTLVLDDDTKHRWISERDAHPPTIGDFLVLDKELNVTYVVSAAKFRESFQQA